MDAREAGWDRIAFLVPPPRPEVAPEVDMTSIAMRTFTGPVMSTEATTSPEWRKADLGALNGHSNARGVLRGLRTLTLGGEGGGEGGGVRLLSPKTIDRVFDVQTDGVDLVLEAPFRFGIGHALTPTPSARYLPEGRVAFWAGRGGSMVVMDLDRRLTISCTMNRMSSGLIGSDRSEAYIRAIYSALD